MVERTTFRQRRDTGTKAKSQCQLDVAVALGPVRSLSELMRPFSGLLLDAIQRCPVRIALSKPPEQWDQGQDSAYEQHERQQGR